MSTTHSHSSASTIDRLASRVAHGGLLALEKAMRRIAHHIQLLEHVVLKDGTWCRGKRRRYISEIRHLTGSIENGRPTTHLLYRAATAAIPELFDPSAELLDELDEFRGDGK